MNIRQLKAAISRLPDEADVHLYTASKSSEETVTVATFIKGHGPLILSDSAEEIGPRETILHNDAER